MACFDLTDWAIFRKCASSLDEYTAVVIAYIHFCVELCIPVRSIRKYSNEKPWMNSNVRRWLWERNTALRSGDSEQYKRSRYELRRTIKAAKRQYRDKLEQDCTGCDTQRMWKGLQVITNYKPKLGRITDFPATLPDELTDELTRTTQTYERHGDQQMLSIFR